MSDGVTHLDASVVDLERLRGEDDELLALIALLYPGVRFVEERPAHRIGRA